MVASGADIQRENGWVAIHPAILELLAQQTLSGREFRCLLFLFRKTYGYQKKEDRISLSQWESGTGIPRTRVGAVLAELVEKKVITKIDNGANRPATWSFNKYFESWGMQTVTLQGDSCDSETVTLQGSTLDETVTLQGDKTVTLQGDNNRKKEIIPTTLDANASVPLSKRFDSLLEELKTTKNRTAKLHEIYVLFFGAEAAPSYAYIGKVSNQVGGAGRLAQLMFELITRPPVGDKLAYIVAQENARKRRASQNGRGNEIKELLFSNGDGNE